MAGLLGLGVGTGQGCERRILSARLCGGGSGGAQGTWCHGLGIRGGGPGGGGAVLMGRARASVLPGYHGHVGGVVAGVWRSVTVNVGRSENLSIFGRTGDSEDCSLLEGVVAAITARRGAPWETLILGSGGGDAPVPYPS